MKTQHQKPFFGLQPAFTDHRVCPVPGEPGRYLVAAATEVLPWLVDLGNDFGEPRCACAIAHNRERARWECRHIAAAQEYARGLSLNS